MRALRLLVLAISLASLPLVTTGCGGDDVPPVPTDGGGRRDAQVDGSTPDGGGIDGAVDSGTPIDGGEDEDGGGFAPGTCGFDPVEDVLTVATDAPPRPRDVGLAAGPTRAAITWSAGVGSLDEIYFAELPASGNIIAGTQVTTRNAITQDPVIVPRGNDWMLAWYGNPDGDFDVYAQAWGADGRAMGAAERLTSRTGRDDTPALLPTPTGALAAWVEERASGSRLAVTRMLGATAAPTAAQRDASDPTAAVSVPRLAHRSGGFVMAWADSATGMLAVKLQPLDANGARTGTVAILSTENNADGTVDLAMTETGGAAVFGVSVSTRAEVRARTIDGAGSPTGPERVITLAPAAGRDASITAFAGGYAIAYRGVDGATPMLRIAFAAANLDVVQTLDVVPVAAAGGRVTIRATAEGRLALAWADVDATTTTIRAARVTCE